MGGILTKQGLELCQWDFNYSYKAFRPLEKTTQNFTRIFNTTGLKVVLQLSFLHTHPLSPAILKDCYTL